MNKKTVLILCTGNSCRSQMAEALINHDAAGQWQAWSAGTRPAGYVHPLALRALEEAGISIDGLVSKSVEELPDMPFDRVYTVCDNAAEDCPVWLRGGDVRHEPFPDPAEATGPDEEQMLLFRAVRDAIRDRLVAPLAN
jgi:arsenate reductase